MTGRMNLPVPFVYGTMLAKPFYSGIFGEDSHLSIYVFNMLYLWNGILLHSSHAFLNNSLSRRSLGIYFVLAQNIKLVHSFITGRMNLPVPFVYGTIFGKTVLFWNIWWRLTSLHLCV